MRRGDFCGRSFDALAIFEGDGDAAPQALNSFFVGAAADFYVIGFGNVRAGFGQFLREVAVVGHQEEAFAGVVEAADWVQAFLPIGDELHHRGAALWIAHGGDVAFGFVQHEIEKLFGGF